MEQDTIRLLGIAGSLRRGSLNRALLKAARDRAPEGLQIDVFEGLGAIPLYNEDLRQAEEPAAVRDLKQKMAAADGLLIATPEYNYGVPGVLKNALDWASRPAEHNPLQKKPAGIMGASPSPFGTVRAQLSLRQAFAYSETYAMLRPELMVFNAAGRFNESLELVDGETIELLTAFLEALGQWTRRMRVSAEHRAAAA